MIRWFVERAPIKQKFTFAFGLQVLLTAATAGLLFGLHYGVIEQADAELAGLGFVVASLVVAILMRVGIAQPYLATVIRMEQLAAGDLHSEFKYASHKDCVGRLTAAMVSFRAAALARIAAEALARQERQAADAERAARDSETAEAAARMSATIDELARGLQHLTDGDLVFRLDAAFAPETERLRLDFNTSMAKLQRTMMRVGTNVQAIRSSSQDISTAADDLSRRTEMQAASLEQTAAALDQITATVKKTAQGAIHALEVVTTATGDAEASGDIVRRAVEAMGGIASSSRQIGQIISVIDEIAFQTNLLALNAGVEAARAGDAGRGFAVVASEVRALAQRSAEAAKEIKGLISTSTVHVEQGVNLVGETGKALGRIVRHVSEINHAIREIAASAQEQSTGLQEVNTAVNQMDQVTQQNVAMVEKSRAGSHELSGEAEALVRLLGRFTTTDEEAERGPRFARGQPATVTALRHMASRSHAAVRKPGAAVDPDGWEEF